MLSVGFVRVIEFKALRAYVVKLNCDLNMFDGNYFITRDAFVRYSYQLRFKVFFGVFVMAWVHFRQWLRLQPEMFGL